jgi:hypothetical protein
MFFIQQQLGENQCGRWTEMPAYFYLNAHFRDGSACFNFVNLTKFNL